MELVFDGEMRVKLKAIELIFKVEGMLSQEHRANRITDLLIELLNSNNIEVQQVISSLIGAACHSVILICIYMY